MVTLSHVASVFRLVVAGILVVSAAKHLFEPYFFASTIASYQILPAGLELFAAVVLGGIQLGVGVALACRRNFAFHAIVSAVLLGLYAILQTVALLRGLNIDCGCFGQSEATINWQSIAIPASLCGACLVFYWEAYLRPMPSNKVV